MVRPILGCSGRAWDVEGVFSGSMASRKARWAATLQAPVPAALSPLVAWGGGPIGCSVLYDAGPSARHYRKDEKPCQLHFGSRTAPDLPTAAFSPAHHHDRNRGPGGDR